MENQISFLSSAIGIFMMTFPSVYPPWSFLYLNALLSSQTHYVQIHTSIFLSWEFGLDSLLPFYIWKPFLESYQVVFLTLLMTFSAKKLTTASGSWCHFEATLHIQKLLSTESTPAYLELTPTSPWFLPLGPHGTNLYLRHDSYSLIWVEGSSYPVSYCYFFHFLYESFCFFSLSGPLKQFFLSRNDTNTL